MYIKQDKDLFLRLDNIFCFFNPASDKAYQIRVMERVEHEHYVQVVLEAIDQDRLRGQLYEKIWNLGRRMIG